MFRTLSALFVSALLGGTALAQPAPMANGSPPAMTAATADLGGPNPDPWEGTNRQLYAIFQTIDRALLRPAALGYARITPSPIRTALHNAFSNLGEPVVFLNDVLQARMKDAGSTISRFAVNSTVGLVGFFDPATGAGLPHHDNGFGNTLGRYGTPAGPYIFLPVLGPSDVRDLLGSGLDILSSPFTWIRYSAQWEVNAARTVIGGLDTRANAEPQLKQVESMSTDTYATIRSLYLQNRQAEVTGNQVNVNALPDFGDQPAGPADATSTRPSAPAAPGAGAAAAESFPPAGPDAAPPETASPGAAGAVTPPDASPGGAQPQP